MKAEKITFTPNGRLTEHIAHVNVGGGVPPLTYRNNSGRVVSFIPLKLILTFQWSWSTLGWHLLEVKVLGRNGVQDVHVKFTNPELAPNWVQAAIALATPALILPEENDGES